MRIKEIEITGRAGTTTTVEVTYEDDTEKEISVPDPFSSNIMKCIRAAQDETNT